MATMSFRINTSSTGGNLPIAEVSITENGDASVTLAIVQLAGHVGDLRGLFFDLADDSLIGSLRVAPTPHLTEFRQSKNSITDLGDGANLNGSFETARTGSVKLGESTFGVITPADDSVTVREDTLAPAPVAGMNLLANDGASADVTLQITAGAAGAFSASEPLFNLTTQQLCAPPELSRQHPRSVGRSAQARCADLAFVR